MLALAMVGCAANQSATSSQSTNSSSASAVKVAGEPWINSNVIGTVTQDTQANVHEDYFVANGKEWLSTTKIPEGETSWGSYEERKWQIDDQLLDLIDNESVTDHDTVCMRNYYKLLADWDARNAAGIEPVMNDVRKVQAISTIDELTAYLLSDSVRLRGNYIADDENKATGETLLTLGLVIPNVGTSDYQVTVGTNSQFITIADGYDIDDATANALNESFATKAAYMLGRAGYSESDVEKTVKLITELEVKLNDAVQPTEAEQKAAEDYLNKALNGSENPTDEELAAIAEEMPPSYYDHTKPMTRDEMAASAGAFPILQIIDAYGFGNASGYNVTEPKWLTAMGQVYNQQNLEALKAHLICGLLLDNMRYLDGDALALYAMSEEAALSKVVSAGSTTDESGSGSSASAGDAGSSGSSTSDATAEPGANSSAEANDEVPADRVSPVSQERQIKAYNLQTIKEDMPGVVTNTYVAHCYPESANERAIELTKRIIAKYRDLINSEDWLDPQTKAAAIEKLDAIEVHVGYPSSLDDTAALEVPAPGSGVSLYDASKALDAYNVDLTQKLLADPSQGTYWQNPMDVNAYYSQTDNAIFVGCGVIGGRLFDENAPIEQQLATLGHTVAHELSHAFDSSGAYFDKDGNFRNWWTAGDLVEFKERTDRVVKYLSTIKPLGNEAYNGEKVCGEMVSDISGLKAILMIAKDIEGFDYEKFFESYLIGWESVGTLESVETIFYTDEHPLNATRANVSVMQVQEFYDTYGIKPGDKMYLAPEDRISIW